MATATITGPIYGVDGSFNFASMNVVFELSHWDREEDIGVFASGPYTVPVDVNGDFSVDLLVNSDGENFTHYQCFLEYRKYDGTEWIREPLGIFTLTSSGTFKLSNLEITSMDPQSNSLIDVYSYVKSIADGLSDSAAEAQQWANADEDVEIETDQYSSKHWSLKTQAIKTQTETIAAAIAASVPDAYYTKDVFTALDVADSVNNVVILKPYSTYKRVTSEPSHAGKLQTNNGVWFELDVERVNLLQFDVAADGITDDTAKIQNAIDFAMLKGIVLFVPAGRYKVTAEVGLRLQTLGKGLVLIGESRESSIFVFDNYNYNTTVFLQQTAKPSHFTMLNIGIKGDFGDTDLFEERNGLILLGNCPLARIDSCDFHGAYAGSLTIHYAKFASVTNCSFSQSYRDACRLILCENVNVAHNDMTNCLDDSIAVSSFDPSLAPGYVAPQLSIVNISNNNLVDSSGIVSFGGKQVNIIGNNITRPISRGIAIGATGDGFESGNTPILAANIHDNTILDPFVGNVFDSNGTTSCYGIEIINEELLAKDTVGTEVSGSMITPIAHLYNQDVDEATIINAGHFNISIIGNKIVRTLGPVTNYSDYGFGDAATGYARLSREGWVDPEITIDKILATQINLETAGRSLKVIDNTLAGGLAGLRIKSSSVNDVSFHSYTIDGNNISNYYTHAMQFNGSGIIAVTNNDIDGDPYCLHASRAAAGDGSWNTTTYVNCSGIYIIPSSGLVVLSEGNKFKNVGIPILAAGGEDTFVSNDDTQICQPATPEINASNKGIGYVMRATLMDNMIIVDADPTSSTFNHVISVCKDRAQAVPTSGYYPVGFFLRDGSASSNLGWKRVNNDETAHVEGVDWLKVP